MTRNGLTGRNGWVFFAAAAAIGCTGMTDRAFAGDWGFHIGVDTSPRIVETVRTAPCAEPVYELRERRIWVEPQFAERTVAVQVAAVFDRREVPVRNVYGRVIGYRTVERLVEPAHTQYRTEQVVVREGYYRTVTERVLVERPVETVAVVEHAAPVFSFGFQYDRHRDRPWWNRGHHDHRRTAVHLGFGH